jgi:outer membrane protein assembly factor BamA
LRTIVKQLFTALLVAFAFTAAPVRGASERPPASQQLIVDSLECRGQRTTPCSFILSHLYLAPGDPLDEEEIRNARLRLSAQPNFRLVDIYLEKGEERGRVRVIVEVREATQLNRELATGVLAGEHFAQASLAGRLSHLNAFGDGEIVELFVRG